jgi:hypothetical protein
MMSETNNSRIEAEECLRKANSCLLLAEINEIVESRRSIEVNKGEAAGTH